MSTSDHPAYCKEFCRPRLNAVIELNRAVILGNWLILD